MRREILDREGPLKGNDRTGGEMMEYSEMKDILGITISLDGDKWCALIGENLQDGLAGFGNSPIEAIRALANEIEQHNWNLPHLTLW
jgi:hypothetical protein